MASVITSALTSGAVFLGKKAVETVLKDRNLLVPLDDIKNTKLITDQDLKKKICGNDKQIKKLKAELQSLKSDRTKKLKAEVQSLKSTKSKKRKKRKSNLDRVTDRSP